MSARKKVDPSLAAQSIHMQAKQSPEASDMETAELSVEAPAEATAPIVSEKPKLRHETSVRFSVETRHALDSIIEACQEIPELKHRIIQKTAFEMGLYVLSKLSKEDLKKAFLSMPSIDKAPLSAPLRIPMPLYTEIVVPLIKSYSDTLKTTKGANVSRMVVFGIHYLHSMLKKDKKTFFRIMVHACDLQYDEGLNIC